MNPGVAAALGIVFGLAAGILCGLVLAGVVFPERRRGYPSSAVPVVELPRVQPGPGPGGARPWRPVVPLPPLPHACPLGPHRGPEGPNEDIAQCPTCYGISNVMRPEGEEYGGHLPNCSLPRRHPRRCKPGGDGHPPPDVVRGHFPEENTP